MKKGKAALYDPYLDVLGGGEKHILSILKVLEEEGYSLSIFWNKNLQPDFKNYLDISFKYVISFLPNLFSQTGKIIKKISALHQFDYFFYVTNGSYFFSSAKKNFIFCMVPQKDLYNMSALNRMKTSNYRFIANSIFTQKWLKTWGLESEVILPYLGQKYIQTEVFPTDKKKLILSVGRFFPHLHSKNQIAIINFFKKLKKEQSNFKDYKMILAGGLKSEDKKYFDSLKKMVKNNKSIELKPNISFAELFNLYKSAEIFWHFAGFGQDENKTPHLVEHFGITPLEAMAMGCITFAYNAGGPKEFITDGKNGFLFNNESDLLKKIVRVSKNQTLRRNVMENAKHFAKENFNYNVFRQKVKEVVFK